MQIPCTQVHHIQPFCRSFTTWEYVETNRSALHFFYLSPIGLCPFQHEINSGPFPCQIFWKTSTHSPAKKQIHKAAHNNTMMKFQACMTLFCIFFSLRGQEFSNNTQENFGNTSETTENNCFTQPYEVSTQKKKRWLKMVQMENNFTNGWDMEWR